MTVGDKDRLIVKIQRDLSGQSILIYDKNREIFQTEEDPVIVEFLAKAFNLAPMGKVYAFADWVDPEQGRREVKVRGMAPDQDW